MKKEFIIYVEIEDLIKIKELAQLEGESVSGLVRRLIIKEIARRLKIRRKEWRDKVASA